MADTVTLPDYLLEPNAVLLDNIPWRHGQVIFRDLLATRL